MEVRSVQLQVAQRVRRQRYVVRHQFVGSRPSTVTGTVGTEPAGEKAGKRGSLGSLG